jgi:hypothetical protein
VWVLLIERNRIIFFMLNMFFVVLRCSLQFLKLKELFWFYETPIPKYVHYVLDLYTLYLCLLCWNIQQKVSLLIGIGSGLLIVVV